MAASKFKILEDVLRHYKIRSEKAKFETISQVVISQLWKDELNFVFEHVPYNVSEVAICENIIYPILKEVWKPYLETFTLWSHRAIEMDDESTAYPDYVVSKNSDMGPLYFENPFVAVVEAKREDFTFGWAQCCSEMVSLQKLNSDKDTPIFGIVSTGDNWQFAKLEHDVFTRYTNQCSVSNLDDLFNTLSSVFEYCKRHFDK